MASSEFQSKLGSIIKNFIEKKKYKTALAELEKLESEFKENAFLSYYLGVSYANTGELRKAIEKLKVALEYPELSLVLQIHSLLLLGYLYTELKDYENAEKYLKEAIEMNPKSSTAYSALGYVYYELKKYDLAIYHFKKAIQLDPNNASAHNNLGYTYLELGINLSEALNECKKATSLNPKSAAYHDSLGWAYYNLGNYKAAAKELEEALNYPCKNREIILEHYKLAIKKRDNLS
jgi:tetratricopeptide (TPR) repeat protein